MQPFDTFTTDKYVSFWGSIFSNWADTPFKNEHGEWGNSEQYFMWQKAIAFGDTETADKIKATKYPEQAKTLGRQVKGFDKAVWDRLCFHCMYKACYDKFTSRDSLRNEITSPDYEGKHFVEGSPVDRIWGVGIIWNSPDIADEKNWRGENLLGKVLDYVRRDLLAEQNMKNGGNTRI